jgi:hypothetical protein
MTRCLHNTIRFPPAFDAVTLAVQGSSRYPRAANPIARISGGSGGSGSQFGDFDVRAILLSGQAARRTGSRTKGADSAFKKMRWQRQHLACIPTPDSPFQQAAILVKVCNISQPLGAGRACNDNHIRNVAGTHTTTDRQLDSLQQSSRPPFFLKPFNRNLRQPAVRIAATTASADRDLPDHQALRFKWAIALRVHRSCPIRLNLEFSGDNRTYSPAYELPGSSLVELRINANSETT